MAEKKVKVLSKEAIIESMLMNYGNFSKDASGCMGLEERLNVANASMNILYNCIKELAKE